MTLWRHLRKGPLRLIHKCGFWKGDPGFTLVFNRNQASILHRSQNIQLLPVAGSDVIVLFPLRGAASDSWMRILKGWPWLHLLFNSNMTSTVHRFQYVIIRCYYQQEMTSQCWLRQKALQVVNVCEFWNFTSTLYLYSMEMMHLSYTVSDIIRFNGQQEMTS